MSNVNAKFYLALARSNRFPYLVARITSRPPALKSGEVMMQLDVSVPNALFERPVLRASIAIDGDTVTPVITAQMQDDIAATLSAQLGIVVHVTADAGED